MAVDSVEMVRRAFDTFNRRDKVAWLADFDPDCVAIPPKEWPENAPVHGAEACWDTYIANVAAFEDGAFELVTVRDAGPEKVIANQRRTMRGKASGADVVYDLWILITLRDGKHVLWEWFFTEAEALEAADAGLC